MTRCIASTGRGYGAQSCPLATPVVTYAYDSGANAKGHLTSMTDQAGTATYGYDILGRLTTETRTLTGANNAAIPKERQLRIQPRWLAQDLHYPSGKVVTYTPDSAGRTLSAIDSGSGINYVTGATYGPDSALTGFISGNSGTFAGITNAFSYNKRLQPLTMSATFGSPLKPFSIGYDFHAGNGTQRQDNGNVWGITQQQRHHAQPDLHVRCAEPPELGAERRDRLQRNVLGGKKKFWGNTYGYDAWGNLLTQDHDQVLRAENLSVTADAHNRIHASGTPDYLYDAAGNMTFNATPPAQTYTYDQENRLTGAAGYTYTYDGDGNRVRKSNGNLAANGTLYWYMTPGVVAETDLAGTLKSEYVFFDGERVARRDGPTGTGGVFYYFSDHLKTASVITDSAGVIKAESDYYPWGGELQFVNNDSNDYKFTGKKRDIETGLDYFGARYYSNGLGRWVSRTGRQRQFRCRMRILVIRRPLNLYGYVRGLPTTRIDADGHCCNWQYVLDFGMGTVQGFISSASHGLVGAPKAGDSEASLLGQSYGTIVEGTVGTALISKGTGDAGIGLVLAPETGGTSLALAAEGGGEILIGGVMQTGAAKNAGAIINAMAKKGTEPGSRPGQDFTPAGKKEIDARDGNVCQGHGCSRTVRSVKNTRGQPTPPDQRQRHHIKPKSEGGSGTPENATTFCPACHKEEHRKLREAKNKQKGES